MQDEIDHKAIALSIKASKLTGKALYTALQKFLAFVKNKHHAALTPHGKQSVKKLMGHGVNTNSLPLDGETRLFDRVARKWKVDYSFHKTGPGHYLLFFKAGQADAITEAFSEYTRRYLARALDKRPSVRRKLQQPRRAQHERKAPQRTREAARDGR